MATCFSSTHYVVTMNVTDWQHRSLSVSAYEWQVDQLREALTDWPELVDFVIAAARRELERLGPPEVDLGAPRQGRASGQLTLTHELSYDDLQGLYNRLGGMIDTSFMPPHGATVTAVLSRRKRLKRLVLRRP
ncbi:MAG TPA: hypothetical protein VK694_01480 [Verrucomicrobiae bacterium]|nr:hypothetical protein [Verrucomicrobiae bacterium]